MVSASQNFGEEREEQSLRSVASDRNISHPALMKKRDKILKKLKEIIGE